MAPRGRFGEITNELIRDKVVSGMSDRKLKTELLRNADLTLEQAVHACRISEVVAPLSDQLDSQPVAQKLNVNLTSFSNHTASAAKRMNEPPQMCVNCNYLHNKDQ